MKDEGSMQPLVSIIIRTSQRPQVLERALNSVRNQTYKNIQVVVVEDGKNEAEELVKEKFTDLNLLYRATGKRQGRSYAGNLALKMAEGKYLNFLDDDDFLLPEHVDTLVSILEKSETCAAYSVAEEWQFKGDIKYPNFYYIKKKNIRYRQPYNRLLLYTFNYIPIQSILFQKRLYDELGGFDENLENLEDWDLWVRYSQMTDFMFVDRVTSCYHVPFEDKKRKKRSEGLNDYLTPVLHNFERYHMDVSARQIHEEMNYVIREYKNRGLVRYMRKFFRAVFYGER